jgi:hypothetical protein
MSLSSDIARGNIVRLAGREGSANLPVRLVPGDRASRSDNGPIYKTALGDSSPSPGRLKETTHNRVTDHEKLAP